LDSTAVLWASFFKLKRIAKFENRYGHGRTGRVGCAGLTKRKSVKYAKLFFLVSLRHCFCKKFAFTANGNTAFQTYFPAPAKKRKNSLQQL